MWRRSTIYGTVALVVVSGVALNAACTQMDCHVPTSSAVEKKDFKLASALPDMGPQFLVGCVPANADESAMFAEAAHILEMKENDQLNWLDMGSVRFLADGTFRHNGTQSELVCGPREIYQRVSEVFQQRQGFNSRYRGLRLDDAELKLAARLAQLPQKNKYVVDAVGKAAFADAALPSEIFLGTDLRPYARTVLAAFGKDASPFAFVALQQMSNKDSLGTGAAQVAAAAGQPEALRRVAALMQELLAATPEDKVIPHASADRLEELSWAIYFSGDAGRPYGQIIHKFTHRKIEVAAPPFGLIEGHPTNLCSMIKHFDGGEQIPPYDFCRVRGSQQRDSP